MIRQSTADGHCEALLERLSRYLDDDLQQADRQRLEQHLRDCPDCEEILRSLEQTVETCREQGRADLPPDLRARALDRVQQLLAQPAAARPRKRPKPQ